MKRTNISKFVLFFLALTASAVPIHADYTWTRAVTELNSDYTNTKYWTGSDGQVYVSGPTVKVSTGNTLTIDKTFNLGAANTTTNLTIDGTLKLTANRPVAGVGNNCVNVINVNGVLNASASNFCFGENWNTKTTMNINSGASVSMNGLVGSAGAATINIAEGARLIFPQNVILGWQSADKNYSYMGLVNQTDGTVTAMGTVRTWTNTSGIGIACPWGNEQASASLPAGQYILSGGSFSTLRFNQNDAYDEEKFSGNTTTNTNSDRLGIYETLGITNDQAKTKCFIMTGGQANIVSVSNITATDSAQFGTLSVPTLFTGGTLNVLKIDASRMAGDTFTQDGGILSPSGGTWANNTLIVMPNGISSTSVTGGYTQNAGEIRFDIASDSSYDTMSVSGAASLNGTLNIIDRATYTSGSQTYTLLTAGSLTKGANYAVNVCGANVGSYVVNDSGNTVTLTVNYASQTYTWKAGTAATNEFLTAANWTPATENANYRNHVFGDGTNNAYAKVSAGSGLVGSNFLTMANGSSTATLDVEGAMEIYKFTTGSGTANLNIKGDATVNFLGTANFNSGNMTLSGNSKTVISYDTTSYASTENKRSRIGNSSKATNFTMTDNASLYVNIIGADDRYFVVGAGSGTTTFQMKDNSVILLGTALTHNRGYAAHWGGEGTVNTTLSGNATLFSEIRLYFGEDNNGTRVSTINLTENSRMFTGLFLVGGGGNTQLNISGNSYLNTDGEFCIGYGSRTTTNTVTQTGGTAEIWGDGVTRWTNKKWGITFGGNGAQRTTGTYQLQGGTLNTTGLTYNTNSGKDTAEKQQSVTAPLVEMSGGTMNVIANTNADSGTIEVPFSFTGGTLNAKKIVGYGNTRSNTWRTDHEAGTAANNTFYQSGGVLSPDGGTIKTDAVTAIGDFGSTTYKTFVASATGVGRTDIVGNYELSGTGRVKLDIGAWNTGIDATNNDYVTVSGTATLGGAGIQVKLSDALLTAVTDGTYTGNGKVLLMNAGTYATEASAISITSWNSQLSAGYTWTPTIEGNNLFGTLRAVNPYWTSDGKWSANVNMADTFYVGSTTYGGNKDAQSAVLTVNNDDLGQLIIGETAADKGKLTISGTTQIKTTKDTQVGLSGTGELVIDGTANVNISANAHFGVNQGSKGTLTIGTQGSATGPTVFISNTKISGEGDKGQGNLNFYSGTFTTYCLDLAHNGLSTATMNMTGGTLNVNGMTRFTENLGSTATFNMSGGTLNLNYRTTWGSHGKTNVTISGGTITAKGQFVLNFYEQDDYVTQTGGTANIWGNTTDGWGVRTNPGFITNYSSQSSNAAWHAGLQFGNTANLDVLRGKNGNQLWAISGGELNTYRISTLINTTDTMLKISGDAVVNVVSGGSANDGKYYGILAVPTEMTGGTLNAETIIAKAAYYNKAGEITQTSHNYMKNGQFLQQGGTLSPETGTVVNGVFIPAKTGAKTTIIGDYVVDLSKSGPQAALSTNSVVQNVLSDPIFSVPVISFDVYSATDYDQLEVTGKMTIDPNATLEIRYDGTNLSEVTSVSDFFNLTGDVSQSQVAFKEIDVVDSTGEVLLTMGADALSFNLTPSGLQVGLGGMANYIPEPSTWALLVLGVGLLFVRKRG